MQHETGETSRRRVPRIKITVPETPRSLVSRPRLLARLDHAAAARVTLVRAPAGSGKTLLLADWARRTPGVAWLSIDVDDNADRRFWSALLGAIGSTDRLPADSPIRALVVPRRPSADADFLATVAAALDTVADPVRLVLDDLHELTDPDPLRGLAALLRHRPAGLRVVLAGRQDPPLALAELAGELTELGADELLFTPAEAGALLTAAGVRLGPDQSRTLVEHADGWAAYLGLAANTLRDTDDPARLLAAFVAHDRPMTEYLVDEVLTPLPADARELLRTISVCHQVSPGLAGALSGRSDASSLLDALHRDTSLVTKDVRSFHMWTPVRDHLAADLRRQTPKRAAELHARAADWYAANDEPHRALRHASQAGDVQRTGRLLRRHALTLSLSGEHAVIDGAIDVLGDDRVATDCVAALAGAVTRLARGDLAAADHCLDRADAAWPALASQEAVALRRFARSCRAQLVGEVDAPPPPLPVVDPLHRGAALLVTGRFGEAQHRLREALAAARAGGHDYLAGQCLTALAVLAGTTGDVQGMTAWAAEAVSRGRPGTLADATAHVALAYGALLRGDLAACVGDLDVADPVLADAPDVGHDVRLVAATLRGTAESGTGDWTAGLRRIQRAREAAGDVRTPAPLALCALLEHRAAVRLGLRESGRAVSCWAVSRLPGCAEQALMRARGQLAIGRHESAANAVEPVLAGAVPALLPWSVQDARLVAAEAALRSGDVDAARRGLVRALAMAEATDVRYPLVFASQEVIDFLVAQLATFNGSTREAAKVLAARRSLRATAVPVPLTDCERDVLGLLPTLRSFDEIAADLTVSVNTVKTHVRAIYAKLSVGRRRDAVLAAEARGLLRSTEDGSDGSQG
ncbi:MAG TPA: LuxR C-terminal-related transcriptional regulator [Pseudonocardiaceae bacterium]